MSRLTVLDTLGARWRTSALHHRWQSLTAGQRRTLAIGAAVLALAWFLAYVWLPALRERERLLARLPALDSQLELMRKQAAELRALNGAALIAAAPRAPADVAGLQTVFGENARITSEPNRGFRVVIARIPYTGWWDRLEEALARYPLTLASLSLKPVAGNAHEVSVEMVLADRLAGGAR